MVLSYFIRKKLGFDVELFSWTFDMALPLSKRYILKVGPGCFGKELEVREGKEKEAEKHRKEWKENKDNGTKQKTKKQTDWKH